MMIEISSDLKAAREAEQRVMDETARRSYGQAVMFAIKLALEEGLNNAIKHGNGYDPDKVVKLTCEIDDHRAEITIEDQGEGFDPGAVPDPTADENIEKPSGRGIMLMRAYMDEVRFNDVGNRVHMVKHNNRGPS